MTDLAQQAAAIEAPRRPWLSPLNQRRWENFRKNRRGWWSLWIFLSLFVVALGSEFVANDRPIVVSYKGELLFPAFVDYPEAKFGGFLGITNYRDSFIRDEIAANGWAIWPPIHFSYATVDGYQPGSGALPPTWLLTREEACARYPLQGSAPMAKPTTSLPACSMAYASPSSSALPSPSSPPSSASSPAPCRAISAAGSTWSSSASSKSGPRYPPSTCC
jgi:hypothetical protein